MDNDLAFHRAQRSGPADAPNPDAVPVPIALFRAVPVPIALFRTVLDRAVLDRAVLDRAIAQVNADSESRAQGLPRGECRNGAFLRLSEGRIARWPSPLQRRWMRLSWHRHKVTAPGQVRHDNRFWG